MEITKFDIVVLITMSIAVVSMSFVFPAVGLAPVDTDEGDIPDFEIEPNRLDFAGEFPDAPGTPTNIAMNWNGSRQASFSDNQVWLNGFTDSGYELLLLPNGTDMDIVLQEWDQGSVVQESRQTFSSDGESGVLSLDDYTVTWTVESYETVSGDVRTAVDVEITNQPRTDGGISRIPVIGTAYDTAETTAATLAWFASIVWWFFSVIIEISTNMLGILFDVVSFLFNLAAWLISTYSSIITASGSWVSIFVAIPGILLTLILAKLAAVAVSLLPTT